MLKTFGCSLTFGAYLQDNPNNEHPSKFAWPQTVAKLMGTECINHGRNGASNREILYRILETEYSKDDVVIVQWTFPERSCLIKDGFTICIGPWYTEFYENQYQHDISESFYNMMDEGDQSITQSMCIEHAGLYLDSIGIKNYHFHHSPKLVETRNWTKRKMLDVNYIKVISANPKKRASDGHHPNEEIHNIIGNQIWSMMMQN